ncbi:MAG: hypothetical protein ABFC24_04700 [Methanoregulaceae archaeon]
MRDPDQALSDLVDESLMIGFLVVMAAILAFLVFGLVVPLHKTAYVIPEFRVEGSSGNLSIAVMHGAGDDVYLGNTTPVTHSVSLFIDTPSGSYPAIPDSSQMAFRPGDTLYLYFTGTGFIATKNPAAAAGHTIPFPSVTLRLVDPVANILIFKTVLSLPSGTTVPTATPTPIITPPSATATPTPALPAVTVSWSPAGLGSASVSPGGTLTNPATVGVASGSTRIFSFTPRSNKAVLSITLDGVTVYSGTQINTTVSYTVSNITASRTLTARFG